MKFTVTRRRTGVLAALVAAFAIFGLTAIAQETKPSVSKKEADLAKKLQEGNDVGAKVKLAEKFVKDYPESPIRDQVARYVAGQIGTVQDIGQRSAFLDTYAKLFTKPGEADHAAPILIEVYTQSKKPDEAFKLGGDYLSRRDDLRVLLHLSIEGSIQARSGNRKFVSQTEDFIGKGIGIIEGGAKPADLTDAEWAEAQKTWRAQLYQSMGFLNNTAGKNVEALANFEMATRIDPNDVNSWAMQGFITNQVYQELARKSVVAAGAEQEQIRKQAEEQLDKVIELFARVVGMTDGNAAQAQLNAQLRTDLETYYKFRHKNSTDGMQALIDKYKKK